MKFFGKIGFSEGQKEIRPGVWDESIIEYQYYGDVIRPARRMENGGAEINNDLTVTNSLSIVADAFARENFVAMRYVTWMGGSWIVTEVEVQHPRLVLRLGGVYHGPKA